MPLDSGGGGGSSDSTQDDEEDTEVDQEAVDELTGRDQDSDTSSGSRDRDSGVTSGSGDTATEDPSPDTSPAARDELTSRDPGSGDGTGDTDSGSSPSGAPSGPGSGVTSGGGETATQAPSETSEEELADAARRVAEENVEETQNEGIEREGVGDPALQHAARSFEQQVIEQNDQVNDPGDVVIRQRDGELVAALSRRRRVELLAQDIQQDYPRQVVSNIRRDDRPAGTGLAPGGAHGPTARAVDDPSDLEFEYEDGDLQVSITNEAAAEIAARRQENINAVDVDDTQGDREPRPPLADRAEAVYEATREQGLSSVERGGALSEAARNTAATALGVALQDPEEVGTAIGLSEERIETHDTEISGPAVTAIGLDTPGVTPIDYETGDAGNVNENVLADLTAGSGLLTEEQRAELREDIEQRRETFDFSDEAGGFVGDVTGSEKAAGVAAGLGTLPGEALSASAAGTLLADEAIRTAPNVPDAIAEYGSVEVAATGLEVAGRGAEGLYRGAKENPYRFAGSLGGAVVGGAVVSRAVRGAPSRVRGATIRARGGTIHNLEDLSDPPVHTEGLGLPGFTKQAQRDPELARQEFIEQAKQGSLSGGGRRLGVGVRRDADSPVLTIDPELKAAIEGAPGRVRQGVATRAEAARTLPARAGGRLDEAAFQAGVRVGDATRRVGALPGDLRAGAVSRLENLDEAAYQAGVRVGETTRRVEALPSNLRAGAVSRLENLDDAAFQAGVRTGRRVSDAEDFLTGLPGDVDDAAFKVGVRTGEKIGDIEELLGGTGGGLDDAAFQAGARVGDATRRVGGLPGALRAGVDARLQPVDDAAFAAGKSTGAALRRISEADPSDIGDLTVELKLSETDPSPVAFHGRSPEAVGEFGGFGSRFEAPEGGSELPGLFQAADLSPLRLSEAQSSGGLQLPRLGLPIPRARGSRVLAEEDLDVGITEGRTNREVSEFLEEDASREQSFIRTDSGGPTPEQEVVAPPGSVFKESGGIFGVRVGGTSIPFTDRRVGGEIITGRLTRRAETPDVDAEDVEEPGFTQTELADETTEAITTTSRAVNEEPSTAAPLPVTTPTTGGPDAGSVDEAVGSSRGTEFTSEPDSALGEDPVTATTTTSGSSSRRSSRAGSSTAVGSSGGATGSSPSTPGSEAASDPVTESPTSPGSPPSTPSLSGPPSTPSSSRPPGPPGTPKFIPVPDESSSNSGNRPSNLPLIGLASSPAGYEKTSRRTDLDPVNKEFEYNVATPEDVLEGDVFSESNGGGGTDDLLGGSGDDLLGDTDLS